MESPYLRKLPWIISIWDKDNFMLGIGCYLMFTEFVKHIGSALKSRFLFLLGILHRGHKYIG